MTLGTATIIQGDARHLPLPDASVDLVCTSPPYFALRSYQDGGQHFDGQIGSEPTSQAWLENLWAATAEMVRVLRPEGSIFINLGDKYNSAASGQSGLGKSSLGASKSLGSRQSAERYAQRKNMRRGRDSDAVPNKSLMGLPWRYAIGCIDQLGLILRAEIIWSKVNGLPESVTDRVRRSHETWFHFTKQPRYYSAVDEIRENYAPETLGKNRGQMYPASHNPSVPGGVLELNPLGKLPGSVWEIPTESLQVPPHLGVDHFAAYPTELPRRIITGWTPVGICVECGAGRRPVTTLTRTPLQRTHNGPPLRTHSASGGAGDLFNPIPHRTSATISGYVCGCTPYTDHPGTGDSSGERSGDALMDGRPRPQFGLGTPHDNLNARPKVGPVREYHFDRWTPAPTTPAIVLDPFGGTGTTALVAKALDRHGITNDLSQDYCRLARWRVNDPDQLAKAARVDKPPPVIDGQLSLLDGGGAA